MRLQQLEHAEQAIHLLVLYARARAHAHARARGDGKYLFRLFQPQPSTLSGGTQSFVLRVHVTSTCGGPVQGALVYGTPTPFNQFDATQSNTGADGWATLNFSRQANFPVNGKQQILAMFLRASKPGENVLAGITGYRLVNVPVNL